MMQLNSARVLNAWCRAPTMGKVAFMVRMLTDGDQAMTAVAKLIAVVITMAAGMSAEERLAISAQLKEEAHLLAPPHDRRALH
jgi:hypothetical protein